MTAKPKYIPISACYAQIADLLLALKAKGATEDQLRFAVERAMCEALGRPAWLETK